MLSPKSTCWLWLLPCLIVTTGCGPRVKPVEEVAAVAKSLPPADPIRIGPDDWPAWRGPDHDNHATGEASMGVPVSFGANQNVCWKTAIPGRGHGSPIVMGDRVILVTADEADQRHLVLCYARSDGERLWETEVGQGGFPGSGQMHPTSTHANGTPACDGKHIFVAFVRDQTVIANALTLDGEIVWTTELGYFAPRFGYAPSPCLHGSLVIFAGDNAGGGFLAAVHRETGEIVWRKSRPNGDTYSSPIVLNVAGRDQLLISGGLQLASYDPDTGEQLWSCPGTANATCGTPVAWNDLVFASGGYPQQETIAVNAATGEKVWSARAKSYEQSMLVANDHLFAFTDRGIVICWDAATGDVKWQERLKGSVSASPLLIGNRIYATNEQGKTWVFEATGERYIELANNQLGDVAYSSPAVSGDRMLMRMAELDKGRQEYLVCIGPDVAQ